MPVSDPFLTRLEAKVRHQLRSQKVGYLIGAGASHLSGKGYPLASDLWDAIKGTLGDAERSDIQTKLDDGAGGLEAALDLLDPGNVTGSPHRHSVTASIANLFRSMSTPLDWHMKFVERLSRRTEYSVPVFCLNYDPLVERAAEAAKVWLVDGFQGVEDAYFDPGLFQCLFGIERRGARYRQIAYKTGIIQLFKLHGSLGWYESSQAGIRRCPFRQDIPAGTTRHMIPPQCRKANDTTLPPFSNLWSEFRRLVSQGPAPLHRLVCIGYGMRDEHVNAVLEAGLRGRDFTLLIFARQLAQDTFERWSSHSNAIVVTRDQCSLNQECGEGHPTLWDFQQLSQEV